MPKSVPPIRGQQPPGVFLAKSTSVLYPPVLAGRGLMQRGPRPVRVRVPSACPQGEIGGRAVTDWLGRRKHARYPIVVPILYGLECSNPVMASAGWTRDLSEGGACLELSERLEVSALIRLFLRTDQGGIATQGQVIWVEGPLQTGGVLHGVVFTGANSAQSQAVQELLSRKRMVWQAVVRIPLELPVIYQLKGQPRSLHQGQTENVSR